jgi:release factor glutamine methyltransferase
MGVNIQTIKDIRIYLLRELEGIYHESEINALSNIIIRNVAGVSKPHQLYMSEYSFNSEQVVRIIEIAKELKQGKPVQYILGETYFYDCIIKLNSSTLIPRPETEELVHLIISENRDYAGDIIDFGTGSGCIAIALAANIRRSKITGIDISADAISIANENALLNNVTISFLTGDILNFEDIALPKAGIIVSNPPYVRNSEKELMRKNVLAHEPHIALFVNDSEPLLYYEALLKIADKILVAGGQVYFEINEAMGDSMVRLLASSGYSDIKLIADINNKDRIIKGTKNG